MITCIESPVLYFAFEGECVQWLLEDTSGAVASEMTYIVSSGALNSTHSLTPGRIWKWGAAQSAGKISVIVPLHFFDSVSTISRFGERCREGQCSLVSFLFAVFLLTVLPRAQLFVTGAPVSYGVVAVGQVFAHCVF